VLIAVWQTYAAHLPRSLSAVDGRVRDGSRRKYRPARNLYRSVMVLALFCLAGNPTRPSLRKSRVLAIKASVIWWAVLHSGRRLGSSRGQRSQWDRIPV